MLNRLLQNVMEAFDLVNDEVEGYLNRKTGECHMITLDDDVVLRRLGKKGREGAAADVPEWQRESIVKGREIRAGSVNWVRCAFEA